MAKEDQSMEEILQSIKRIIAEESEPAPSGSDVLELTDLLAEENSMDDTQGGGISVGTMSIDEIMAAPLETSEPIIAPAPAPAPIAVAPQPAPQPVAAPEPEPVLASEQTIATSSSALDILKNLPHDPLPPMPSSGLHFRSGTTIEDLVLEALRPMLKDWLDANLTPMVERLVEKEVRRLSSAR